MCKKSHFSTIECDFICSVGSVQSSKFQVHIPQLKTTWSYSRWWWRSPWRHSHLRFHSCPHGLVLRPRRFCWICADFAPIFEPKSWSQTNKLDLVFLKLKKRKPLCLLGISDFSRLGARTDSNRRHSEPQAELRMSHKPCIHRCFRNFRFFVCGYFAAIYARTDSFSIILEIC